MGLLGSYFCYLWEIEPEYDLVFKSGFAECVSDDSVTHSKESTLYYLHSVVFRHGRRIVVNVILDFCFRKDTENIVIWIGMGLCEIGFMFLSLDILGITI